MDCFPLWMLYDNALASMATEDELMRSSFLFGSCTLCLIFAWPAMAQCPKTESALLVVGDSLSAAHGIQTEAGWVALMQQRLLAMPLPITVHNVSISGQTAQEGATRLPAWLVQYRPQYVILALGANDGLRGVSGPVLVKRLTAMVHQAHLAHAKVLLMGVRLPPNYGQAYLKAFRQAYQTVAKAEGIVYIPRMLWQVSDDAKWMQADRLHPTAAAQPRILNHVWPTILSWLGCQGAVKMPPSHAPIEDNGSKAKATK